MEFKIEHTYDSYTLFEFNVSINGYSYLVIYGRHINGGFCCIPNWGYGCEMGEPMSIDYNAGKLESVGLDREVATAIAKAICKMMQFKMADIKKEIEQEAA